MTGTLKSVDQYLNIKLDDISVHEELRYPHLSAVKNVFIRGSVVRYVHLPASAVDVTLLEDAARRGEFSMFTLFPGWHHVVEFFNPRRKCRGLGWERYHADDVLYYSCRGLKSGGQGEVSE